MTVAEKDTYFVALKVFLEKDRKFLILKDGFGEWDIPGGRITTDEFDAPLESIIRRKMTEELGADIQYSLGKPIVFMRHEREEATPENRLVRIFAIGYQARFTAGEVSLSSHHTDLLWADIKTFDPVSYFTNGWLKGVQDYLDLKRGV